MRNTGSSQSYCHVQSARSLPSWIKACIALGAIVAAALGTIAVAGGNSAGLDRTVSSPRGTLNEAAQTRSGTLVAYRVVYRVFRATHTPHCYSACHFDPLSWGIGVQN
jgi:hypothetical protein